jgi:hypothetical protein
MPAETLGQTEGMPPGSEKGEPAGVSVRARFRALPNPAGATAMRRAPLVACLLALASLSRSDDRDMAVLEQGPASGGDPAACQIYVSFVMCGRVDDLRGDYVGRLRNSVEFLRVHRRNATLQPPLPARALLPAEHGPARQQRGSDAGVRGGRRRARSRRGWTRRS